MGRRYQGSITVARTPPMPTPPEDSLEVVRLMTSRARLVAVVQWMRLIPKIRDTNSLCFPTVKEIRVTDTTRRVDMSGTHPKRGVT